MDELKSVTLLWATHNTQLQHAVVLFSYVCLRSRNSGTYISKLVAPNTNKNHFSHVDRHQRWRKRIQTDIIHCTPCKQNGIRFLLHSKLLPSAIGCWHHCLDIVIVLCCAVLCSVLLRTRSYQFAIKHDFFNKQMNKWNPKGRRRWKEKRMWKQCAWIVFFFVSNSLLFAICIRLFMLRDKVYLSVVIASFSFIKYTTSWTNKSSTCFLIWCLHYFFSFFFISIRVIIRVSKHQFEWAHQNERCNN